MKILIFGAGGMIGHKMLDRLSAQEFEVWGTVRGSQNPLSSKNIYTGIDVTDTPSVIEVLSKANPDVVLNCVGITLRKPEIQDEVYSFKVNADFPKFLNSWAEKNGKYVIQFSTDCVFSGKDGPYTENSHPSAQDIYGRSKAAGEVISKNTLVLRGSMIGRELTAKTELLEWAISKRNQSVSGFSRVMYSGVTTIVMAKLVAKLLKLPIKPTGIYQVSSEPISKYELLKLINEKFGLGMNISDNSEQVSSKILSSQKLQNEYGFVCPSWPEMVNELALDSYKYE